MIEQIITCPCCNHTFSTDDSFPPRLQAGKSDIDQIKLLSNTFNIELAEGGDKKNNGYD
ncbi:hypothetical protein [Paenibacillus illinoisensis]|uniref:Uncharacterized protein n=1 Tax=Paenibacillus illinoisensis TaxID=59845 RepID=A0A2W0CCC6_9BACL|nr:hypothetical protein [Paenibacillus illinoisensis]PYY28349.1 hypothetical protein PIL02S_03500 [Paenibacillus illinoisensis]